MVRRRSATHTRGRVMLDLTSTDVDLTGGVTGRGTVIATRAGAATTGADSPHRDETIRSESLEAPWLRYASRLAKQRVGNGRPILLQPSLNAALTEMPP